MSQWKQHMLWRRRRYRYGLPLAALAVYYFAAPFNFKKVELPFSSELYTSNSARIAYLNRDSILQLPLKKFGDIPQEFIDFLVCSEDRDYWDPLLNPGGIPLKGTARAFLTLGKSGGGSGIIQQTVKNALYSHLYKNHRTLNQKASEAVVAYAMNRLYTREVLMLLYLNVAPVNKARGLLAASRLYIGKEPKKLNWLEIGALATAFRGGRFLNSQSDEAISHRNKIFSVLWEKGKITGEEYASLTQQSIAFQQPSNKGDMLYCGAYKEFVRAELSAICRKAGIDSNRGGLKIITAMQWPVQKAAGQAMGAAFGNVAGLEAGLAAVEPGTGYLRALIGSSYADVPEGGRTNHAFKDFNQAGSILKPFVYGVAFDKGDNQNTTYLDGDLPGKEYQPANYNDNSTGQKLPAWQCLKYSINKPVANLIQTKVKPAQVQERLRKCGISHTENSDATLALGAEDVSPLEMAAAYAMFQSKGLYYPPIAILEIQDKAGKTLWRLKDGRKKEKWKPSRIYKQSSASAIIYCLQQVLTTDGTGHLAGERYKGIAFGKTGTTQNNTDAWFVGVTPKLATAIWIGYNDNHSLGSEVTGGKMVAPVWADFMNGIRWK